MEASKLPLTDGEIAVLLSAKTGVDKIDLVQSADGTVMILLNDEQVNAFRWASSKVEEGAAVYMRILADQPSVG
jgi:hypothetical protein